MRLNNVILQRRNEKFVAYYNGDDAPFMEGLGYTEECALHDLYQNWKTFHYPDAGRYV